MILDTWERARREHALGLWPEHDPDDELAQQFADSAEARAFLRRALRDALYGLAALGALLLLLAVALRG